MSHLYEEKHNTHGCLMRIVEYNGHNDIVVEFQDKHMFKVNTTYSNFKVGCVRNPYYPTVYGVGITGIKYPTVEDGKLTKEYITWCGIIKRCFNDKLKQKQPAYKDAMCCDEWLNYENFYEWLHSQENFDRWINGYRWALDKDILIKGNKLYSPDTCCLVPQNVNCLLLKRDALRGNLPLGVRQNGNKFQTKHGTYETAEEAFYAYKLQRENYIKQVATFEYESGNIIKSCYEALVNYSIEIDD